MNVKISKAQDIPAEWRRHRVKKSTLVQVRACKGVEQFSTSWGELTSDPDKDVIVIQPGGKEYPVKQDIFWATYETVPLYQIAGVIAGYGYRKKTVSIIVEIPQGVTVQLETLEGSQNVAAPDYIATGPADEVYANGSEWVKDNLIFV